MFIVAIASTLVLWGLNYFGVLALSTTIICLPLIVYGVFVVLGLLFALGGLLLISSLFSGGGSSNMIYRFFDSMIKLLGKAEGVVSRVFNALRFKK